ncbi:response regulator [Jeotgalibacillus sp. R-1-5s-1]|uniref:response regulator n=1 Tax=Jeotgalibacillus sp. R-1-5s-1 TaxID=2555897 RepID=UPI00106C6080|nr:response regulator [Jeotgalibacillus sp. R-1-5s-1]TFE00075.1 response regulator [Jeotgalibacillus sp. R-1-5s-1]
MSGKYQEMLITKIKQTTQEWKIAGSVTENELYRFLHGLKGTAGTVGMTDVSEQAEESLNRLEENGIKVFQEAEWKLLLPSFEEPDGFGDENIAGIREVAGMRDDETAVTAAAVATDVPFILIIEQDTDFITKMKTFLEEHQFQVLTAVTAAKGLELYYDMSPDLLIVSMDIPDMNGLTVINQMMKKARKDLTPIILVSSHITDEKRIAAYNLGVLDFIGKPLNENVIVPFIKNRIFQRNTILSQIRNDFLTGALKRDCLDHELQKATRRSGEIEKKSSVLSMLDLDHFKNINDTYGHPKGDEVLQLFAKMFLAQKRPEDKLIRYGGEEFAVIFPDTSYKEAEERIQAFREAFSSYEFASDKGSFHVTFSAGLLEWSGAIHPKEMLESADKALYYAKEQGRNCSIRYDEVVRMKMNEEQLVLIVVDDDELVREMLKDHFEKRGKLGSRSIKVHTFSNGIDFLEGGWYEPGRKYMVLLDGMMPKMDGIEVLVNLREKYGNKNLLISMLTARQGDNEVERALSLGADDYMIKPFNVREVASRIDRMMERVFA